jgi:Zn-finger nucleic acid-binding protein
LELDLCTGCSGVWFDRAELQALGGVLSNEQLADDFSELLGALYKGSERTGKVYLSCPVCRELMQRKVYASVSGVQICRCEAHGTWVDRVAASRLVRLLRGEGDAELRALEAKHREGEMLRRVERMESAQVAQAAAIADLDARARLHLVLDVFDFV